VLFKKFLEYVGIEPERLHFSWISSAEATKFAKVAEEVVEAVKSVGPARYLVKREVEVE
jgi:coenzyme F420-reducing hydrogenase delta subunit